MNLFLSILNFYNSASFVDDVSEAETWLQVAIRMGLSLLCLYFAFFWLLEHQREGVRK